MKKIIFLLALSFSLICPYSYGMERLFYILRDSGLPSLKKHYRSIDTIITQAYQINADGLVVGFVNPDTFNFVNQHEIKTIVLVTNAGFNKDHTHQFLANSTAQTRAIQTITEACVKNHYHGVQFDFENININDKENLTRFYLYAANILHQQHLRVSFAVMPVISDGPQPSNFLKRKFENWGGAYDLKALGQAADFISIMAYDQHQEGTIPGPIASIRWVDAAVKYALQFVPANKISLGIPVYSGHWYTSNNSFGKISTHSAQISYAEVKLLVQKNNAELHWNKWDKINYAIYERAWLNEYIFVEDAKAFKAKLTLVKNYHLRGISVFNLGNEDPGIWDVLHSKNFLL